MTEYDIVINNGLIIDGLGQTAYHGSVAIKGERITSIGNVEPVAERVIDAKGSLVTPGFIDVHSHADLMLNWFPRCENYAMQGVTTFVGGLCGDSPAPLGEYLYIPFLYFPLQQHYCEFIDYKYYPNDIYPMEKINEWMKDKYGWEITWREMAGFFDEVDRLGISINYVPFVGHCTVRQAVMGSDAKRAATDQEVGEMVELIHKAMEQGCVGLSTGIDYDPGTFAERSEVNRCVEAIKEYGGIYSTHWRRTGRRRDWAFGHQPANPIQGIIDELETAKKTGVKIQLSHLSPGYQVTPPPPRSLQVAVADATLEVIDKYIAEGVDAHFDVIPFNPNWDAMPYLCSLLEPWLRELGGRKQLARWLKSPDYRQEIKEALRAGKWWIRVAYNPVTNFYWSQNVKVVKSKVPGVDGKTLEQISKEWSRDPMDVWFDIISEDPETRGALRGTVGASDAFEQTVFKHSRSMVGIDTFVYDDKYQQTCPPYSIPGVNTYGAYPSFLKRIVEENSTLPLEEAITRCCSLPAASHKIEDRGALKVGYYADINVIDWGDYKSLGDEVEPRRYPSGVHYVLVNGKIIVDNQKMVDVRPGKILTRKEK
jgi:N-acyl-D-amino-acid deacylase